METSYANTTVPLDQGQGTAGCPTKGPDCTPPPEVDQVPDETAIKTDDTSKVTNRQIMSATKEAEARVALDVTNGNAECSAKGPHCTSDAGFNLLAAAENQNRRRELARQKQKSRLKA